ncbi:MAG: aminotransferase class V-fold PLP-dependent enzyme [Alphaproteobacteria bacterium]|nr:aminotransferase class V-fold PLP-dependent enzyme [Alphaproteobacteria bacterium]MCL2889946.1 aminotransferase class V-fold PLP-dependent enzyme [Alphaproteobacteria bacterium]
MEKKTIYVDAAASALKPESVIAVEMDFLRNNYANAGRGICARAGAVDAMVADARSTVARFIGAANSNQIVFTSGATDGLNRITNMLKNDSVVAISDLDHHSARLPFEAKHKTIIAPLDTDFNYDAAAIPQCDAFVITAMSNVLGAPQDIKRIITAARTINPDVITIVDAAQYAAHLPIDVVDWDCDFLCFSGHKIGADTGVGVMYVKEPQRWSADKFGGGMVVTVTGEQWTLATPPAKFEAGTLPLTQIIGLGEAVKNHKSEIINHKFLDFLRDEFSKIPRIKFVSQPGAYVLTFTIDDMHALDFGALMGAKNICLRVGNMCASWMHARLGIPGTIRISVGPWNTMDEMEQIVKAVREIIK